MKTPYTEADGMFKNVQ